MYSDKLNIFLALALFHENIMLGENDLSFLSVIVGGVIYCISVFLNLSKRVEWNFAKETLCVLFESVNFAAHKRVHTKMYCKFI